MQGIPAKERGTFAAVRDKIPYLKELGVTTVEFMPVYEFEELILKENAVLPGIYQLAGAERGSDQAGSVRCRSV